MARRLILRWHIGLLGWSFVVLLAGAVLFGVAAFDPELAADLADQRRGSVLRLGESGGVNWLAAVLAAGLLGFSLKAGWRWAGEVAVSADENGLAFHRSTLRKALRWNEIRSISYARRRRTGALAVETAAGDLFTVPNVDPTSGPEFARVVGERWLALPPPPAGM